MTITFVGSGTAAQGTTTVSPDYHASWADGDLGVCVVATGQTSANTPTMPTGWTLAGTFSGGTGSFGAGTGPRRLTYFVRVLTTGDDTTPTVSLTSGSTMIAAIQVFHNDDGATQWAVGSTFGQDTTSGTGFSATCADNPGIKPGDFVVLGYAICDTTATSSQAISASGATFSSITERIDSSSETGNDLNLGVATGSCTSGSSTADAVVSATLSTSESGAAGVIVIRAVALGSGVRLWPSTDGDQGNFTDTSDYTLGTEFEVSEEAYLTAIQFWVRTTGQPTEAKPFLLYRVESATVGVELVRINSQTLSTNQWNRVALDIPVFLIPGQRYRVCVFGTASNFYSSTANYWSSGAGGSGITNGVLSAPNSTDATGNDQGGFFFGGLGFPNDVAGASNYWVDPEVATEDAGTNAPAESTSVSVVADNPTSTIVTNSESAAIAVVTNQAQSRIGASPPDGAVAVTANNPTPTGTTNALPITGNVTIVTDNVNASIRGSAGSAAITVTANDPTVTRTGTPQAESAAVAVTANNASISISSPAEHVLVSVVGNDPSVTRTGQPLAESAAVTVVSNNPTVTRTGEPQAGSAAISVVGHDTTSLVSTSAEHGIISVTANDATISLAGNTNAFAQTANVDVAGNNTTSLVNTNSGEAILSVVANDSTVQTFVNGLSGSGAVSVTAGDATINIQPSAQLAAITATANDLTATIRTTPDTAVVSVVAEQPTVQTGSFTSAPAGVASISVVGNNPGSRVNATSEFATLTLTTNDPFSAVSVPAQGGQIAVVANTATILKEVSASSGVAELLTMAFDASIKISPTIESAAVGVTATNTFAQTVIPEPDLVIREMINDLRVVFELNTVLVRRVNNGLAVIEEPNYHQIVEVEENLVITE